MIAFRKRHAVLHRPRFFTGADQRARPGGPLLARHQLNDARAGTTPTPARWPSRSAASDDEPDLHVMLNMHWDGLEFELPAVPGRHWHRAVDTALPSPDDIARAGHERPVDGATYRVNRRSVVALISQYSSRSSAAQQTEERH